MNIYEVNDWPRAIWGAMKNGAASGVISGHCIDRLRSVLQQGVAVSTAYSGMGGDFMGLRMTEEAMLLDHFLPSGSTGFKWTHCCDTDSVCRRVLCSFREDRAVHITRNICDRLPQDLQAAMDRVCPEAGGDPELFECQFDAMKALLQSAVGSAFSGDTQSYCDVHEKSCKIYDSEGGEEFAMKIGWAGTSCLDVCRPGKRLGRYGPQSKAFLTWVFERRARREQVYFQESTEDFDPKSISGELGDIYTVFSILLSPEDFGWWASRPRRFSVMVLRSAGFLSMNFDDFVNVFFRGRPAGAKGHMFWCADPEIVAQRKIESANEAMVHCTPGTSWTELLGPGNKKRLDGFDQLSEQKQWQELATRLSESSSSTAGQHDIEAAQAEVRSATGKKIYNVRQEPGENLGHMTDFCPTLLRSSVLWSQAALRPLLGEEHLVVQGVPAVACGSFRPSWYDLVPTLTQKELRALAGNSIHSMISGALTIWVLAAFVPREVRIVHGPGPVVHEDASAEDHGDGGDDGTVRTDECAPSLAKRPRES
jgi:hypothetical protein